jgi:hypothetical protein
VVIVNSIGSGAAAWRGVDSVTQSRLH